MMESPRIEDPGASSVKDRHRPTSRLYIGLVGLLAHLQTQGGCLSSSNSCFICVKLSRHRTKSLFQFIVSIAFFTLFHEFSINI